MEQLDVISLLVGCRCIRSIEMRRMGLRPVGFIPRAAASRKRVPEFALVIRVEVEMNEEGYFKESDKMTEEGYFNDVDEVRSKTLLAREDTYQKINWHASQLIGRKSVDETKKEEKT